MGILKNMFGSNKSGSCCGVKIEEAKPQPAAACCNPQNKANESQKK